MIDIINERECCGCEACVSACPKQCISMKEHNGFYYPIVKIKECISCDLCNKTCPMIHHNMLIEEKREGVAGYIKDSYGRYNSTSGGAAFAFYKQVVLNGGVAYGVVFDDSFQPAFSATRSLEQLTAFQGSKYPQSRIIDTYQRIKSDLSNGEQVVFVGTPCQAYGLNNYLGRSYDNLVIIDLICHGVASPEIWRGFLDEQFGISDVKSVTFKHKELGWKNWSVRIETSEDVYAKERIDDAFMSSYLCGYNVRPSCFSCPFKGRCRVSDITIADAWGEPEQDSELNDNKGLSSIIINTEKGKQLFELTKGSFVYKEYDYETLIAGNKAYDCSIRQNAFHSMFFKSLKKRGTLKTLNKFSVNSHFGKVLMKISTMINKKRGGN